MKAFDFCRDYNIIGLSAGCEFALFRNGEGGLELMKDGVALEDVLDISVNAEHGIPRISVTFPVRRLQWDADIYTADTLSADLKQILEELGRVQSEKAWVYSPYKLRLDVNTALVRGMFSFALAVLSLILSATALLLK